MKPTQFLITALLLSGLADNLTAQSTNAPLVDSTTSTGGPPATSSTSNPGAQVVNPALWSSDINTALKQAEDEKKMVLVEVSPDWDISAKRLEAETFTDPKVEELLHQAILVKINPESSDDAKMMAARLKVFTYPAVLILNYKGSTVAMAIGFQDAGKFAPFISQNVELFKENPLGPVPLDSTPDDPLMKAKAIKPDDSDISPQTLYYDLLVHEEITLHKDGSYTIFRRRAMYMAHPEMAPNDDDISGVATRYDPSRKKIHYDFARIITTHGTIENLDFNLIYDKPYHNAGDMTWDEHRLIARSRKLDKGEILDSAVTMECQPRVPGHFELFWNTSAHDKTPVVLKELILRFPAEMNLSKTAVRCDLPVKETKGADGTITWEIKSTVSPQSSGTLFLVNPSETWSGYLFNKAWTWDDLASWYRGQISGRDTLSQAAKDVVQQIKLETPEAVDLPFKIRDWVKHNVNYYFIEFQNSSFQPHTAEETFHYRCGDAKDMALLLQAMLRESGIPSCPVLLKTGYGSRLNADQPMITQFDHCIIAAQSGGHDVYLDPVAEAGEGDWLPLSDANTQGLKIGDTKTEIVTLPPYRPRTQDAIRVEAKLDDDGGATLTSNYQFFGDYANSLKAIFARLPEARAQEVFALMYKTENEKLIDFVMSDPRQNGGSFNVTCVTSDPEFTQPTIDGLMLTVGAKTPAAETYLTALSKPREVPFRFYPSDSTTTHYIVDLPPGTRVISKPDDLNLDTPFLTFTEKSTQSENQLEWITTYATKDATIPADRVEEVRNAFQQIEANRQGTYVISSAQPALAAPSPTTVSPVQAAAQKSVPTPLPGLD